MKGNALNTGQDGKLQQILTDTTAEDLEKTLKYVVFAEIISADNDKLDEDTKQEIIRRYDEFHDFGLPWSDWDFILEPIEDSELRNKYLNVLN